jgi:hypothetical protein
VDAHGETYWFGSQCHPNERSLALSKEDLLVLPKAFEHFNGFYARYPNFVLFDSIRILVAEAAGVLAILTLAAGSLFRFLRRRWQRTRAA